MKNETKVWDLFAPVYNVFMRTNRTAYEQMYTNIRAVIKDKIVLEIACGTGLISKNVADAAESYIATDFSENMLKTARKGYVPDNLTFEREDAAFLSFDDDTFDVVIIANALHIIPQPEKVLAEIDRVLTPNGVLIAPNFIHDDSDLKSTVMSKVLSAAGITFEAKWNETSYKEFLAENCWKPTFDERLKASIPLMYVQCARASEPSEYMRFDPYLRYAPKPDYKNWVPNGMVTALCAGTGIAAAGAVGVSLAKCIKPSVRKPLSAILVVGAVALGAAALWSIYAHEKFSYKGDRKLSKQIVEGVAKAVKLPENGVALDVGCGSGALIIACAKRNPNAKIIGIDRWGAEYASFSKSLCESNAEAEGVTNVEFKSGNAVKLDFPDEKFDAVTSNYVYHNITGVNKQDLLLETLRVLKKGGTFAIHDIMSEQRYGDMWEFADKLIEMGYKDVKLIDTTDGKFMTKCEAKVLGLSGSTLLTGTK